MTKFAVTPEKEANLQREMARLGIREEDLIEKFVRGSGPGGQKINKTSSTVYLKHVPSNLEVKCQKTRSQALNRYFARRELCERIAARIHGDKTKKQQEIEKIRRQKQRRSRKQKEKMLAYKHHQGTKKQSRKPIRSGDDD